MGDWTLAESGRLSSQGFLTSLTGGVTVTGGTANTKGSYAALGNAPYDCDGIIVNLLRTASGTDSLLDIAFGASGSERVVIENIYYTGQTSGSGSKQYYFPLRVPANTRVSARLQNTTASVAMQAAVTFLEETFQGLPSFDRFVTYGALPASSSATALGAPGAGAWGAWTTLAEATAAPHKWLSGIIGDADISTRTAAQRFAFQVGQGSAGNEVIVQPELWFNSTSTTFCYNAFWGIWQSVARAQRLSMRYGSSAATTLGAEGVIIAGCG